MKRVRLKIPWDQWSKGHVFTAMPAAQAEMMVAAGQAEYVTEAMSAPVDRMMRPEATVTKRPRGRPAR